MDRRKALRNIGTGIGAIAVTPTVVSLFQSCQTTPSYATAFFSQEQFAAVSSLMELIIPATDIPGAIELKLPEFADAYIAAVWDVEGQDKFQAGADAFMAATLASTGKAKLSAVTTEEWEAQLAKYLKADGWIVLEHGYDQQSAVIGLLQEASFNSIRAVRDFNDLPRLTLARISSITPNKLL